MSALGQGPDAAPRARAVCPCKQVRGRLFVVFTGLAIRAACPCKQVRSQRPSDFTELSTNLGSLSTQTGRQFVVFTDLTTRAVCPCEQVRGRLFLQSYQPRQLVHANRQSVCSLYRSVHANRSGRGSNRYCMQSVHAKLSSCSIYRSDS